MDAKVFDKSRLPSRYTSVGPDSAPHRAFYYAMGMTEAEIAQPFVGVATCWNETAPCNISLARQAQVDKLYGLMSQYGTLYKNYIENVQNYVNNPPNVVNHWPIYRKLFRKIVKKKGGN